MESELPDETKVKTFGQVAFEAYVKQVVGLAWDKRPIPPWDDITMEIRAAWETAAEAVILEFGMSHPRVLKLMMKRKPFLVVALDEPYAMDVYVMIREREMEKGTWTEVDEHAYEDAI